MKDFYLHKVEHAYNVTDRDGQLYKIYLISEFAEADCFFCFTNIMSDIRDFFIKSLDEAESGINAMMTKLMSKLGGLDPEVKEVLDQQGIRPQYFSFRYVMEY